MHQWKWAPEKTRSSPIHNWHILHHKNNVPEMTTNKITCAYTICLQHSIEMLSRFIETNEETIFFVVVFPSHKLSFLFAFSFFAIKKLFLKQQNFMSEHRDFIFVFFIYSFRWLKSVFFFKHFNCIQFQWIFSYFFVSMLRHWHDSFG